MFNVEVESVTSDSSETSLPWGAGGTPLVPSRQVSLASSSGVSRPSTPMLTRGNSLANLQRSMTAQMELARAGGDVEKVFSMTPRMVRNRSETLHSRELMSKIKEKENKRARIKVMIFNWELFITVSYFYGLTIVPYNIAYHHELDSTEVALIIMFEWICIIDLIITHFSKFWFADEVESDHDDEDDLFGNDAEVMTLHTESNWVLLGLEWIGGFPYQTILISVGGTGYLSSSRLNVTALILVFFRLLAQGRFRRMYMFESKAVSAQLLRMLIFSSWMMHFLSCIGFTLSCYTDEEQSWCEIFADEYETEFERSIQFWYMMSIALQGENISPNNVYEAVFSLVLSVFGAALVAVIFGTIYVLVEGYSDKRRRFEKKIASIEHAADVLNLPEKLTKEIKAYNEYTHKKYTTEEFNEFKGLMTEPLSEQVSFWQFSEYLSDMDLLEDCSVPFIRLLCNRMSLVIFAPGDTIIEQGDQDSTMFLVYEGRVGVYVKDDPDKPTRLITKQGKGSYFGEISLLYSSLRRTATVKALEFCDVFKLTKDDVEAICERYPEDATIMFDNANRLMKDRYSAERLRKMFDINQPGAVEVEEEEEPVAALAPAEEDHTPGTISPALTGSLAVPNVMDNRRNSVFATLRDTRGVQLLLAESPPKRPSPVDVTRQVRSRSSSRESTSSMDMNEWRRKSMRNVGSHDDQDDVLKSILDTVKIIKTRTGELNYEISKINRRIKLLENQGSYNQYVNSKRSEQGKTQTGEKTKEGEHQQDSSVGDGSVKSGSRYDESTNNDPDPEEFTFE